MTDKDKFLRRNFLHNVQHIVAFLVGGAIWYLIALFFVVVLNCSDDFGLNFLASSPFLIFGIYNLITYFYSGIIMVVYYIIYKQVYFYQAMGDRWPRVFAGGTLISRILNGEKGKPDINGDKHGK